MFSITPALKGSGGAFTPQDFGTLRRVRLPFSTVYTPDFLDRRVYGSVNLVPVSRPPKKRDRTSPRHREDRPEGVVRRHVSHVVSSNVIFPMARRTSVVGILTFLSAQTPDLHGVFTRTSASSGFKALYDAISPFVDGTSTVVNDATFFRPYARVSPPDFFPPIVVGFSVWTAYLRGLLRAVPIRPTLLGCFFTTSVVVSTVVLTRSMATVLFTFFSVSTDSYKLPDASSVAIFDLSLIDSFSSVVLTTFLLADTVTL